MFGAQLRKPGSWWGKNGRWLLVFPAECQIWGFVILLGHRTGISGYCGLLPSFFHEGATCLLHSVPLLVHRDADPFHRGAEGVN